MDTRFIFVNRDSVFCNFKFYFLKFLFVSRPTSFSHGDKLTRPIMNMKLISVRGCFQRIRERTCPFFTIPQPVFNYAFAFDSPSSVTMFAEEMKILRVFISKIKKSGIKMVHVERIIYLFICFLEKPSLASVILIRCIAMPGVYVADISREECYLTATHYRHTAPPFDDTRFVKNKKAEGTLSIKSGVLRKNIDALIPNPSPSASSG